MRRLSDEEVTRRVNRVRRIGQRFAVRRGELHGKQGLDCVDIHRSRSANEFLSDKMSESTVDIGEYGGLARLTRWAKLANGAVAGQSSLASLALFFLEGCWFATCPENAWEAKG